MRHFLFLGLFLAAACIHAQSKFGVKIGASTPTGSFGSFNVSSPDTTFMVALKEAKYSLNGGVWLRFGNRLFVQPEVYFNSNTNSYQLDGGGFAAEIRKEKFQYLDVPVIFGLKMGPLSLQAGPVGHYFVKSTGDLLDLPSYDQMLDDFSFGYQAGGGLDFGRVGLDVRYQGRFNNDKGHMTFFGKEYQFDKNPAVLTASLRYKFF